jgi:hypothetical protein
MVTGLLWWTSFVDKYKAIRPTATEDYQAPSWSWASVNRETIFGKFGDIVSRDGAKNLIEIQESNVRLRDPNDIYGQVDDGHLVVIGTTYSISWKWTTAFTNYKPQPKWWPELRVGTSTFGWKEGAVFPDDPCDEGRASEKRSDLLLIPVRRSLKKTGKDSFIECLILEPTGRTHNEFRRFGYFGLGYPLTDRWWAKVANSRNGGKIQRILV